MRRMVPHKGKRGAAALERLKCFDGVPAPYDKVKRLVVPDALKALRLQQGHRFCKLGDLSTSVSAGGSLQVAQDRSAGAMRVLGSCATMTGQMGEWVGHHPLTSWSGFIAQPSPSQIVCLGTSHEDALKTSLRVCRELPSSPQTQLLERRGCHQDSHHGNHLSHARQEDAHPDAHSHMQVGWKHQDTLKELEVKRKAKSAKFYEAKKKLAQLRAKAVAQVEAGKA